MFRAVPLPTIRSLFTVHSALVYIMQVCRRLSSRTHTHTHTHTHSLSLSLSLHCVCVCVCVAELRVTVSYVKILSGCTSLLQWQIYFAGNNETHSRTPLIRVNWDGKPSGYAENPDNWIFYLNMCYIDSMEFGCYYLHYVPVSELFYHA